MSLATEAISRDAPLGTDTLEVWGVSASATPKVGDAVGETVGVNVAVGTEVAVGGEDEVAVGVMV
jgi:hypothetical protein